MEGVSKEGLFVDVMREEKKKIHYPSLSLSLSRVDWTGEEDEEELVLKERGEILDCRGLSSDHYERMRGD